MAILSNGEILERYQKRFQHILIDEFQDSSRVMVELVRLLSQPHRNLWLAGDDEIDQAKIIANKVLELKQQGRSQVGQ